MKPNKDQAEYAASIAVIGKSGRFPKAENLSQFWQNLCNGKEAISFFTDEELLSSGIDPELLRRPNYVKAMGIVEDADLFDAQFFGFTPREAQLIDPQQRIFLECAWEALEDAGYASDDPGLVGVYASSTLSTYMRNLLSNAEIMGSSDIMQLVSGNDKDYVATRVSYKLNLRGPSVCVQSACSSSLVAVHMACRSLLTYECDLALAGGVSIGVPFKQGYLYEEGGITSPDGHCRAFDARANGTIIGYGCGIVVLKRLFDAIQDGDAIQAIIRGSAVNNDGSSKVGFTAPSVDAQADVIRSALAVARVPSETVNYIEAHGTGTVLGDPIELTALSKAFRAAAGRKAKCAIGSIKSSIGHLDAAAGVAGLIKTVLTLEHKTLVPSLNFETPNPKAGFDGGPFYVNTHTTEWPVNGTPRRAGVTSLGIGGTNVHVVLEEAPELEKRISDRKHHLLLFSAKSQAALESLAGKMSRHLQGHPELQLSDVAYSLQVGRKAFSYRRAMVCETLAEAIEGLEHPGNERVASGAAKLRNCPVIFMFPGGGTQYPGMGRELYQQERVFRENFDKCTELLAPILGRDLRNLVHSDASETETAAAALIRPSLGLPAIFATEYAMAQLFRSWGIEPKSMIGHSLGEYAAACVAGVFTLPDALALVALRGKLFETLPPGAMLSVNLPESGITALRLEDIGIAAINGPDNCVISGSLNAIEQATGILESKGIEFRRLHIDAASHSPIVDPIVDELGSFLRQIKLSSPTIPFISNLTGAWITPEQAVSPDYWMRHLRHTVRFADGISELLKQPDMALLELGPGHTLSTLARALARGKSVPVISSMKHPHETAPETRVLYASLGRLWLAGVEVNWKAFHSGEQPRRVSLPTYPFERRRYFIEPVRSEKVQYGLLRKKPDIQDWFYAPSWKRMATWKPSRMKPEAATWVVFSGGGELESGFMEELRKANHEVSVVLAGRESADFEQLGAHEFCIDPGNAAHYQKLFAMFPRSGPINFLHFWSLTHGPCEPQPSALRCAFYSLFLLAQAAGEAGIDEKENLWIVSNDVATVFKDDRLSPDKAILLGPCRSIPHEYPNLHCGLIDVGTPERNAVSTLLQYCANPPQSSLVAYRMGQLWNQCLDPLPLPGNGADMFVRENGVYLITGGLGRMGLTLALHLAKKAKAKLVLVDLVSPPAREDWDRLPNAGAGPDAARFQIDTLRNLEELQTPLLLAQVDVCDESQVRKIVAQAIEKFGAIHGVIHAAGMPGGGRIQFKTPTELENVLAPKIEGTRVLERVFKELELDFFVACSSVTSIQGEFAQVDNCSANAFLDAFCLNNSFRPSTRTVAIGWDTWKNADTAQSTGLPAHLENQRSERFSALSTAEVVEVFDRILNIDASRLHILVTTQDLDVSLRRPSSAAEMPQNAPPGTIREQYSRPELSSILVAPRNDIERQIAEVWQTVLGLKAIGVCDNFWELGGNSLLATQVVSRLKERFHIPLPLRTLFELPTTEKLGEEIARLQMEPHSSASSASSGTSELQTGPISRVDRNGKLPLSYSQERLWFINQLEPENTAYNVPAAVRIQGPLEVESLRRTLQEIVRRHESLRTHFTSVDGEPQQIIDSTQSVELPVTELGHLPEAEREAEVNRVAREEARRPFDLASGPVFRMGLLRLADQDHVLILNMHHIVCDSWSMVVLLREVSAIYNSFTDGRPSPLPELDIQYADFSAWQRELLSGSALERQLEYWKRKLAGVEPLNLPTDRPRTGIQRPDGAAILFTVPLELTESLKTLSRKQGATLFMILLGAFQALLGRYSGQSDISVGSPIAGRLRTEAEALIGVFINTLVFRTDLSGQPDSIEFLRRVKEMTMEAYAHQDVPFEKLVEVLLPQRDTARSPLFQVLFVLQNVPWTAFELGAAKMLPLEVNNGASQFEISLILVETSSGMEGSLAYNTNLFDAATIRRMIEHYQMLLSGILANPQQSIASLPLQTAKERQQVIEEWNRTEMQYPLEKCLHELFEEQAERRPQAEAVVYEGETLRYGELNCEANRLAHYLRALGVRPDGRVALCVERGKEMMVGLLGVLKAGGAYVPLDPTYPEKRLRFMLEDSAPVALVTQRHLRGLFAAQELTMPVIELEQERPWEDLPERNPDRMAGSSARNAAYVIYTSGSSGEPKGVMVEHKSVVNLLNWTQHSYRLTEEGAVLQNAPIGFDASVTGFFWPLLTGARVVMAKPDGHKDVSYLWQTIRENGVTAIGFPISMLPEFIEAVEGPGSSTLRHVMCGGEALPGWVVRRFQEQLPEAELHNLYGPTETTVASTEWTCCTVDELHAIPIGKPIANTRIYILDGAGEPVPVGVPGEMYIGGAGVARGYLNRPELTAERFVSDTLASEPGARMYKTGDLGKWRADGHLEFLGRLDDQVKIRGYRIELGEIEAALREYGGVHQAVVIAREDQPGEKRLVAYVVPEELAEKSSNGSASIDLRISELRKHLLRKLPEYMVPSAYVQLQALPVTQNGKVDRKKLPQPTESTREQEYVGPRSATEEILCRLWQEVLRQERVGIHDNFFEIGGHSLLATRLAARMRESFKVDVPLRRMFESPTIAQLAEVMNQAPQAATANDAPSDQLPAIKRVARTAVSVNVD